MKTVAVTGASGFVGHSVVNALLERGYAVKALVRNPAKSPPAHDRLTVTAGTLTDPAALASLLQGADAVVHLVGIIMEAPKLGQTFDAIHHQATRAVVDAAVAAGVQRFVHMSALGTRPHAVSDYHKTKWLGEEAVRASPLRWTIIRPSLIHGPQGEFVRMVRGFWTQPLNPPLLVPDCSAPWYFPLAPAIPYFGDGLLGCGIKHRIQPVFVEDVARVFADAVALEKSVGETYELGGPESMTWPDLYAAMGRHLAGARKKKIVPVPAWWAKFLTRLPVLGGLLPFNRDQVVMSQEESTCNLSKVKADFGLDPAEFESTFASYASRIV